jgi:hypothetical protein
MVTVLLDTRPPARIVIVSSEDVIIAPVALEKTTLVGLLLLTIPATLVEAVNVIELESVHVYEKGSYW